MHRIPDDHLRFLHLLDARLTHQASSSSHAVVHLESQPSGHIVETRVDRAGGVKDGALTLEHVNAYNAEVEKAGVADGRVAPAIIPDYTEAEVRERQLTSNYVGNLR